MKRIELSRKDWIELGVKFAIFLAAFIPFFVYYNVIIFRSMPDVPFLAWTDVVLAIGEPYSAGTLNLAGMFTHYSEHGMFGYNIFLLMNLAWCGGTLMFDLVLNAILIVLIALMLFVFLYRETRGGSFVWWTVAWVFISIVFCCIGQRGTGGMETQVRLAPIAFLPLVYFTERLLRNRDVRWHTYLGFSLSMFFAINVFGTIYTFAIIPFFVILFVVQCIRHRRVRLKEGIMMSVALLSAIFYFVEYWVIGSSALTSGTSRSFMDTILNGLKNIFGDIPGLFMKIFGYYGAGVLSWNDYTVNGLHIADGVYVALGVITFLVTLGSLVVYLWKKLYRVSLGPVFLISYTFFVCILVAVGRPMEWQWLMNEWYAVHVKYGIVGVIWIFYLLVSPMKIRLASFAEFKEKKDWKRVLPALGLLCAFLVSGGYFTVQSALANQWATDFCGAVYNYNLSKQGYLLIDNPEDMPVDDTGLTPILVDLDQTMEFIHYIKANKYFIYRPGYISYPHDFIECNVTLGLYGREDPEKKSSWIEPFSIFPMNCGNGIFDMEFYVPEKGVDGNNVSVYWNDVKIIDRDITEGYNHVAVYIGEKDQEGMVKVKTRKPMPKEGGDQRNLGIMLLSMSFVVGESA